MHTRMEPEKREAKQVGSSFFVMNVWEEEVCPGHIEWRGEILNVDSNELISFHDWPELVAMIANAISQHPLHVKPTQGEL